MAASQAGTHAPPRRKGATGAETTEMLRQAQHDSVWRNGGRRVRAQRGYNGAAVLPEEPIAKGYILVDIISDM